jgi:WD repeat-containing protein WRAP73
MDFSELFNQSGANRFSPDGKLLAVCEKTRCAVRDAETLQILCIFPCKDVISKMEWSPDSCYLLCAQYKRRIVQVWSVEKPDWKCTIDEGKDLQLVPQTYSPSPSPSPHCHLKPLPTPPLQPIRTCWTQICKMGP